MSWGLEKLVAALDLQVGAWLLKVMRQDWDWHLQSQKQGLRMAESGSKV